MARIQPRLSIGLPVYNGQNHLAKTLESLLSQSFGDFELIISDNNSNDGTEAICRRMASRDRRIRYIRLTRNIGAAANFNLVFQRAKAPYFKWTPHDDLYEPTCFERCMETLEASPPDVVLCYPRTLLIDEDDQPLGPYDDLTDLREESPSQRLLHLLSIPGCWCHAVMGVIRRDVLRKTNLIGPFAGSDNVLLVELALQGKFSEVPEKLFQRRVHRHSSLHANPTPEQLATWFDPRNESRAVTHRLTRLRHKIQAIGRADLPPVEKLRCYAVLARVARIRQWTLSVLGREILRAFKKNTWDRYTVETAAHHNGQLLFYRLWALLSGMRRRDMQRIRASWMGLCTDQKNSQLLLDLAAESLKGRPEPRAQQILHAWLTCASPPHREAAARALGLPPQPVRVTALHKRRNAKASSAMKTVVSGTDYPA